MDKLLAKSYRTPRFVAVTKSGDTKYFRTYHSACAWLKTQEQVPLGFVLEWNSKIGVGMSLVRSAR